MPRFITRLAPLYGARSLRISVTWRKAAIRRISLEYSRPGLARRLLESLRR
jgi:hypothetical protein